MRHKTLDISFVTSVFDIMTSKSIAISCYWRCVKCLMLVIQKNQNITEQTIITLSGYFTFDPVTLKSLEVNYSLCDTSVQHIGLMLLFYCIFHYQFDISSDKAFKRWFCPTLTSLYWSSIIVRKPKQRRVFLKME